MKVSVITINYNNASGLRKTIESVVNQTCKDYEYIIIDGGSTDGSVDVIKEYSDKTTYWISEKDSGIYNAMNKGIKVAKGEYCIFMNSGDCFYDSTVLHQIESQYDGTDIIVGNVYCPVGKQWWGQMEELSLLTFYKYSINHQGAFIRTEIMKQFYYDEKYKICSDWKFFIEAIVIYGCSYKTIQTKVALFGVDGIGISGNSKDIGRQEQKMILEELFSISVVRDLELTGHWRRLLFMIYPFRKNKFFKLVIYSIVKLFQIFYFRTKKISYKDLRFKS